MTNLEIITALEHIELFLHNFNRYLDLVEEIYKNKQ
jgi:hypothetical protein